MPQPNRGNVEPPTLWPFPPATDYPFVENSMGMREMVQPMTNALPHLQPPAGEIPMPQPNRGNVEPPTLWPFPPATDYPFVENITA